MRALEAEYTDMVSVENMCRHILSEKKRIDVLINNAGTSCEKSFAMTSVEDMEKLMKVNFISPTHVAQLLSRSMIRQKDGIIINILSRAAIENRPGAYAYGASKAALLWGTKAMAKELARFNVRVNGIAPGLTETKMGSFGRSEDDTKGYVSSNNIKRPAKVEEIANVVSFLISSDSSYISGQVISVDGGRD